MYSTPMFSNIGNTYPYAYASTILACISILVTAPIYFFYRKGPEIRERSPFAKQMMEVNRKRRLSQAARGEKAGDYTAHVEDAQGGR
jgi:hypothetical protein